jgi:RHS repeat-associated protein
VTLEVYGVNNDDLASGSNSVYVPPPYQVSVTPDATPVVATSGVSNSQVFTVQNTGTADVTFTLTAVCSRVATNCQAPASVAVSHFTSSTVTVNYQAGVNDTGTVKLRATYSTANDSGWVKVTAPPYTTISTDFTNNDNQNLALCANECFAATATIGTVPYFSLGAPRRVVLAYHGDRVSLRPFVYADVSLSTGAPTPLEYWLEMKDSLGVLVRFLNGEQKLRFNAATQPPLRLAGQFDASSYTQTKMYQFTVIVTAQFPNSYLEQITKTIKLMFVNERNSYVARGWTVAGVPRLYVQGDGSALITKGDGSAVYFTNAAGSYGPTGEFSRLSKPLSAIYLWSFPDSTKVWFRNTGQADSIADRFGNTVRFEYDAQLRLTKIYDPIRTYNGGASRSYMALRYNPAGHGLAEIQEPSPTDGGPTGGRLTRITVNSDSTLRTFTDPAGGSTTFGYDVSRRLASVTDRRGGTATFVYASDNSWKLARVDLPSVPIDAGGGATQVLTPSVSYRPWQTVGVPTTATDSVPYTPVRADSVRAEVTDAGGHTTRYTVDRWGQPLKVEEPLGRTTTISRAGVLPVKVVSPAGAADTFAYNGDGLLTYARHAGENARNISYGPFGQVSQLSGTGQPTQTFYIGARGHIDSTKINGGYKRVFYGDSRGRDTLVVDPLNHQTRFHYDSRFGHLDSTLAPGNRYAVVRFDGYGRDSIVRASGVPADTTFYDILNRVRRAVSGADGRATIFGYDSLFLTRVQDPKGQVFRREFNALGWVTRRYDPADTLNRYISHRYNLDGLLTSSTNRRGQRIDLAYDVLHRVLSKTGANVVADYFAYDTVGRRTVGWNAVSRDSIFTSATGWVDSAVTTLAGRRFRRHYRPTALHQLDSIGISTTAPIAFAARRNFWNPGTGVLDSLKVNGRVIKLGWNGELLPATVTFPINLQNTATFTAIHAVGGLSFNSTAIGAVLDRGYGQDSLGRMTQEHRPDGPDQLHRVFTFNGLGELRRLARSRTSECVRPPGMSEGEYAEICNVPETAVNMASWHEYDLAGNMVKTVDTTFHEDGSFEGDSTFASYLPGNRLSAWGSVSYSVDEDGNRTAKIGGPTPITYHWTADGLMDSVRAGTVKLAYDYDAFGRLVRRSRDGVVERHFLWDQDDLLAELNGTGSARIGEYAYYPGVDGPVALIAGGDTGLVRYYHRDAIGNVIGLFSNNSAVSQVLEYDPWGSLEGITGTLADTNRLRWKGLVWEGDSTRLYYARARWYDPESRRFMSEDPVGSPGAANMYTFGGNDPVNYSDPTGREMWCAYLVTYYFIGAQLVGIEVSAPLFCWGEPRHGEDEWTSTIQSGPCTVMTFLGPAIVDARVAQALVNATAKAWKAGYRGDINDSFRTDDEQEAEFVAGRTPLRAGESPHQAGTTVDMDWRSVPEPQREALHRAMNAYRFAHTYEGRHHFEHSMTRNSRAVMNGMIQQGRAALAQVGGNKAGLPTCPPANPLAQ